MHFSSTLILASVMAGEAMAGPILAHRHAHMHAKKDVDFKKLNWDAMGIDWKAAYEAGQAAKAASSTAALPVATNAPIIAAAKKPATTPAAASSTSSSAKPEETGASSDSSSSVTTPWSKIVGMADKVKSFGGKVASTGEIISKSGNIGTPEGSNMMRISSVGDHKYTANFINTSKKPMTIMVWNKAQKDTSGTIQSNLGSCLAGSKPALSITLAAGGSQLVAFDEDTQAGFSEATTDVAVSGAFATTWGELNFVETGCGYDVSSIMNAHGNTYDMAMSALETPCISDMNQNLWIGRNNNPEDPIPIGSSDGSCFVPAGKATLTIKMGGQQ